MNEEYVLLDTGAFDAAIAQKDHLISEYDAMSEDYDRIVRELLEIWQGKGAAAFGEVASNVRTNIGGIKDILTMMMDILIDCEEIFQKCDSELGVYNQNPT